MLRINLLPVKKIKQQAEAWNQLKVFSIVFAALMVLLVFVMLHTNSIISGLNANIVKLEAEKAQLATILKEIEELEKKKKAIDEQTTLIEKVEKTSALTARVLDEVANRTPNERLWLTSLNQSGGNLNINGIALDNQTIAEYLENLDKSLYVSDVKLANATLVSQAGRSLKSFSLSCAVGMPESEAKEGSLDAPAPGTAAAQSK